MLADLPAAPWFRRLLVSALLLGFLLLTYSVLQPFIVPLIWGSILAYVSWPLHLRVLKGVGGRGSVASLVTTLAVSLIIVLPLVWLVLVVRVEALAAYAQIQDFLATKPMLPQAIRDLPYVGSQAQKILDQMAADPTALRGQFMRLMDQSSVEVSRLIGGVGRNVAKLLFAVLSLYFLLRDGPRLMRQARAVLAGILGTRIHSYLDAVGNTTQAVVYALMLGAIAQGTVAGIGYWIFDVEAPALMGALTAVLALIPFGAPIIWASLALWALVRGDMADGVGLLLWGILLVSWVDNIVRPLVISNATRMPFLLVVFGVLGGVMAFGLVGLFIGPVLLAVARAIWHEWLEQHFTADEQPARASSR